MVLALGTAFDRRRLELSSRVSISLETLGSIVPCDILFSEVARLAASPTSDTQRETVRQIRVSGEGLAAVYWSLQHQPYTLSDRQTTPKRIQWTSSETLPLLVSPGPQGDGETAKRWAITILVGTRQPLLDSPCLLPAIALLSLAMEQLGEEVPNSIARCKLSVAANISRLDQRSDRPNFTIAELRGIVVKSMDRTTSIKQKRQNERWTGPPKKRKGGVRGG